MTARQVTCVYITCDTCKEDYTSEDAVSHYETLADAEEAYAADDGLTLTGDRHMCGRCVTSAGCALVGHDLTDWRQVTGGASGWLRWCRGCGYVEGTPHDPALGQDSPVEG